MKIKSLVILSMMMVFSSVAFSAPAPNQNVYGFFRKHFQVPIYITMVKLNLKMKMQLLLIFGNGQAGIRGFP